MGVCELKHRAIPGVGQRDLMARWIGLEAEDLAALEHARDLLLGKLRIAGVDAAVRHEPVRVSLVCGDDDVVVARVAHSNPAPRARAGDVYPEAVHRPDQAVGIVVGQRAAEVAHGAIVGDVRMGINDELIPQRLADAQLSHNWVILALPVGRELGKLTFRPLDIGQQTHQIPARDVAPGLVGDSLVERHHLRRARAALRKSGAEQQALGAKQAHESLVGPVALE